MGLGWKKAGELEGLGRRWTEGGDGFGDGDVLGLCLWRDICWGRG